MMAPSLCRITISSPFMSAQPAYFKSLIRNNITTTSCLSLSRRLRPPTARTRARLGRKTGYNFIPSTFINIIDKQRFSESFFNQILMVNPKPRVESSFFHTGFSFRQKVRKKALFSGEPIVFEVTFFFLLVRPLTYSWIMFVKAY